MGLNDYIDSLYPSELAQNRGPLGLLLSQGKTAVPGWFIDAMKQMNMQPQQEPQYGMPSGTGADFLSGITYMGRKLSDPGSYIDPTRGGDKGYTAPFLAGRFISEQMGPGGYLSPGQSSLEAGNAVSSFTRSREAERAKTLNALIADGIEPSQAHSMLRDFEYSTGQGASGAYQGAMSQGRERGFDAMQGLINLINQSSYASQQDKQNIELAKLGANAAMSGANKAAGSSIFGALLGAGATIATGGAAAPFVGAAAAGGGLAGIF